MTGLDPVIHVSAASAWMAGSSPAMTIEWIELIIFMA
jgi:hypothetical protein